MSKDIKQYHEARGFVSPRAEKWIKGSAITAMIIVALSSAILSFTGLQQLALDSKIPQQLSFLFPIAVDVTILMGSLAVLLYEMFGIKAVFGWFTVLFGTLLSVTGNVISVANEGIIAQVLHGIIPILLCISLESLLRILRFNIKKTVSEVDVYQNEDEAFIILDKSEEEIQESETASRTQSVKLPQVAAQFIDQAEPDVSVETSELYVNSEQEKVSAPIVPSVDLTAPSLMTQDELKIIEEIEKPAQNKSSDNRSPIFEEYVTSVSVAEPLVNQESVKKKEKHRTDSVKATTSRQSAVVKRNTGSIDDFQREMLRDMVAALPVDFSESKKLSEILKTQPDLKAVDIRYIMKYPADKRVDSLLKRARDIVLSENS